MTRKHNPKTWGLHQQRNLGENNLHAPKSFQQHQQRNCKTWFQKLKANNQRLLFKNVPNQH
jgi:hypothetical protein